MVDVLITFGLVVFIILAMIHVVLAGVFFERKVSALIQNRVGANRASIFGVAALGLVNTGLADPIKFLLKEDVRITGADAFLRRAKSPAVRPGQSRRGRRSPCRSSCGLSVGRRP